MQAKQSKAVYHSSLFSIFNASTYRRPKNCWPTNGLDKRSSDTEIFNVVDNTAAVPGPQREVFIRGEYQEPKKTAKTQGAATERQSAARSATTDPSPYPATYISCAVAQVRFTGPVAACLSYTLSVAKQHRPHRLACLNPADAVATLHTPHCTIYKQIILYIK